MTKNTNAGIQTIERGTNASNLTILVSAITIPTLGIIRNYVDSIEVAKIPGKKHFNLVRSIDKFIEGFRKEGINTEDYFTAWDTPRGGISYFITELGCTFLAENLKSEDYIELFNVILVKHFILRKSKIKEELEAAPAVFAKAQADRQAEYVDEEDFTEYAPTAKGLRGNDGNDPFYLSTLQAAQMVGTTQDEFIVFIEAAVNMLERMGVNPTIMFLKSWGNDSNGEEQECYLITKDGCEGLIVLMEDQGYNGIFKGVLKGVLEVIFNDIEGARANGYIATA